MTKKYQLNVILQSPLSGCFYFCKKVEVLGGGIRRVIGSKVDVSESMRELFGPMLEREDARIRRLRAAKRLRKCKKATK